MEPNGTNSRLKRLRTKHLKLTQKRMAAGLLMAGYRPEGEKDPVDAVRVQVLRYERDRAVPAEYLAAVATAFRVSPRWLLLEQGEVFDVDSGTRERAFDFIATVVDAAREAAPDQSEATWLRAVAQALEGKGLLRAQKTGTE